jgi:hypothetical protein
MEPPSVFTYSLAASLKQLSHYDIGINSRQSVAVTLISA